YCEHRDTLFQFARLYHRLGEEAGKIMGLDYFIPPPGGRSAATGVVRQTPKKAEDFFAQPPEKTIGIVIHLLGDLFHPRFAAETGLHVVKEKKEDRLCLIEAAPPPLDAYKPPEGIDRQGAIKAKGAAQIRAFDRAKGLVKDKTLGERPWSGGDF